MVHEIACTARLRSVHRLSHSSHCATVRASVRSAPGVPSSVFAVRQMQRLPRSRPGSFPAYPVRGIVLVLRRFPPDLLNFFFNTRSAAVSANALSFRRTSRSNSLIRELMRAAVCIASLVGFGARPRATSPPSAASAADSATRRHSASCASCSPSRLSSAPRSLSLRPAASVTMRSFSAPVHVVLFFFVFPEDCVIPLTLHTSRSHRERATCDTPTSCDNAFALTARGPTIRATIRERNASLYCATIVSTSPPLLLYTPPVHTGRATTILTQGGNAQSR